MFYFSSAKFEASMSRLCLHIYNVSCFILIIPVLCPVSGFASPSLARSDYSQSPSVSHSIVICDQRQRQSLSDSFCLGRDHTEMFPSFTKSFYYPFSLQMHLEISTLHPMHSYAKG